MQMWKIIPQFSVWIVLIIILQSGLLHFQSVLQILLLDSMSHYRIFGSQVHIEMPLADQAVQ
jgi:hypothetical protein